jgi:archaeal cell division control protein 6
MALFKDILKADETLVSNESALDFDFIPRNLPYREQQQKYIATCISPLLKGRMGKHLFVHGTPGVGKTASIKWVLRDLHEETDEVYCIFVNCWHQNTTYKVLVNMCD